MIKLNVIYFMDKMVMILLGVFFIIFMMAVSYVWYGDENKAYIVKNFYSKKTMSDVDDLVIRGPQFYYPGKGNNYT